MGEANDKRPVRLRTRKISAKIPTQTLRRINKREVSGRIDPVIDRLHALRMDFGLWVEPEMVNPDSDLYRAHPDWILNFHGRPHSEARNQYVLTLARSDVRAFLFNFLDELLNKNDLAFLNWASNRAWSEPAFITQLG